MAVLHDESEPVDPIDEELLAYLDDELSDDQRSNVESRLATDETYRVRLQTLRAAWESLDLLPPAEVGEDFTRKSVEFVTIQLKEEQSKTQALQIQKRYWLNGWMVGGGVAAAMATFLVTSMLVTTNDRELLDDLPVIDRIDEFLATPSVEFLEQLRSEGVFPGATDEAA
jgi:anti-sigma factor RsiW